MGYRHGSHTVFEIHLHLVWVTMASYGCHRGEVGVRILELVRLVCRPEEVEILKGHVSADHVPPFVAMSPQAAISRFVQRVKGKNSYKLLQEFKHLRKTYWGRHVWARGYFCCSSGNVTDEVIQDYIENQRHEEDTEFKVEGEDR